MEQRVYQGELSMCLVGTQWTDGHGNHLYTIMLIDEVSDKGQLLDLSFSDIEFELAWHKYATDDTVQRWESA